MILLQRSHFMASCFTTSNLSSFPASNKMMRDKIFVPASLSKYSWSPWEEVITDKDVNPIICVLDNDATCFDFNDCIYIFVLCIRLYCWLFVLDIWYNIIHSMSAFFRNTWVYKIYSCNHRVFQWLLLKIFLPNMRPTHPHVNGAPSYKFLWIISWIFFYQKKNHDSLRF